MNRFSLAVFLCLIGCGFALPIPDDAVSKQFMEYLPEEVVTFLKELTPDDVKILEEVRPSIAESLRVNPNLTEEDSLRLIKSKSVALYDKISVMYDALMKRVNRLSKDTNAFVTYAMKTINKISYEDDQKQIAQEAMDIVKIGENLSEEQKQEIFDAFPTIQKFFEDPKVKKFIMENKDKTPEEILKAMEELKRFHS
ncbi:hypothetical protein QR680_013794 [Steinernema hermaphroditum]|uniref:Fatty-acid and retinol-binding protein 1 n=1 Tax=Steinernema hermaphroditum TaxID=289476 RepID=A0AA39I8B1_9BILA|nr:hypothetical protein QR680_013794 [Steinernema hermaphroditum]